MNCIVCRHPENAHRNMAVEEYGEENPACLMCLLEDETPVHCADARFHEFVKVCRCETPNVVAYIDYGDLGAGHGGPVQNVYANPGSVKVAPYAPILIECVGCNSKQYVRPFVIA